VEVVEGLFSREGSPLCRRNPIEKPPNKPLENLSSVGGGTTSSMSEGGRRVTFQDHDKLGTQLSQLPLVVSCLGMGVEYCMKVLYSKA
jgi:hypothetical protein